MSTLSVQSITGVSSFDFSNTTFANAYNVANGGFSHSNTTLTHSQTVYAAANSVFGVANGAFGQSNNEVTRLSSSYVVANAAFGKANTALQNTTGNFSGSLGLTGSLGVGTTSISSELTVDGVLPKLEMRSGGYLMMRPVGNNWDMRLQSNGATLSVFSGGDLTNAIATFVHGGSVGIGTASPGGKFHIQDSSNRDGTGHIMAENISTDTAGLTNSQILVKNRYGASQFMQWESNGLRIGSRWTANSGSGNIYFTTGGDATNMTIDSSGRVLKPNQPAFWIEDFDWSSSTQRPHNGYVRYNIGNHYNNTNGYFTAPIAGRYMFICTVQGHAPNETSGRNATYFNLKVNINGVDIGNEIVATCQDSVYGKHTHITYPALVVLNANDVFYFNSNYGFRVVQNSYIGYLLG